MDFSMIERIKNVKKFAKTHICEFNLKNKNILKEIINDIYEKSCTNVLTFFK